MIMAFYVELLITLTIPPRPRAARSDCRGDGMNELSTTEARELRRREAVIERGLHAFLEVGTALCEIRDR